MAADLCGDLAGRGQAGSFLLQAIQGIDDGEDANPYNGIGIDCGTGCHAPARPVAHRYGTLSCPLTGPATLASASWQLAHDNIKVAHPTSLVLCIGTSSDKEHYQEP